MAAIRSKDTKPEMIVRRGLWKRGFRYRLNHKRLPGHPDLVLRKYRTCIFVNGCFWHGHHISLTIDHEPLTIDHWYDLNGRKIQTPKQRGIYINNGKKVVIK